MVQGVLAKPASELDTAALGDTEVSTLADDRRSQLGRIGSDRVVCLVANLDVRLGRGFDVGSDAAVPQKIDRRPQDEAKNIGWRQFDRAHVT